MSIGYHKKRHNDSKSISSKTSTSNTFNIPSITNICSNLIDKKNNLYIKNYMNNVYNNDKMFSYNDQPVLYHSESSNSLHKNNKNNQIADPHSLYNKVASLTKIATGYSGKENANLNENNGIKITPAEETNNSNNNNNNANANGNDENYNKNKNSVVYLPQSTCDSGFLNGVIKQNKEDLKKDVELLKQNSSNEFSSYLQKKYGKSKSDLSNEILLQNEEHIFDTLPYKNSKNDNEQSQYLSELLETLPNGMESLHFDSSHSLFDSDMINFGKLYKIFNFLVFFIVKFHYFIIN